MVRRVLAIVGRAVAFLAACGAFVVAGTFLVSGVILAGSASGWSYADDPDRDPGSSDMIPVPPFTVGTWPMLGVVMTVVITAFVAAQWFGWWALQPERMKRDEGARWQLRTRIFAWQWFGLVAACFAYAGTVHALNWVEWHAKLRREPGIPFEPDPSQIPAGTAIVVAVIAVIVVAVVWLKRVRKL